MKKATVAVFLLLSVPMAFGRTVTDQEVATALKRALRARDNLSDTAEVQVSSALATGKDICIEYRASTASGQSVSGLAVYRTEDELVFLDNSWIWERACLSGKYGQRRNGKDLTHALNASLAAPVAVKPAAVAAVVAPAPAVAPAPRPILVASAPKQPTPAQPAPTATPASSVVLRASAAPPVSVQPPAATLRTSVPVAPQPPAPSPLPSAQPEAQVAPAAPAIVTAPAATQSVVASARPPAPSPAQVVAMTAPAPAVPPAAAKPVAVPTPSAAIVMANSTVPASAVAPAPIAASAPAVTSSPAVALVAQPAPVVVAPVVVAPTIAEVAVVAHNPAAATETRLHGVTIIDDNGALGSPTSTASATGPVESLADVARRVRTQRTMQ